VPRMDPSATDHTEDQVTDDFDRRSALVILWTGIAGLLVVLGFSILNWSHLTTALVLWAALGVSVVPMSAIVALTSKSATRRSVALAIDWAGWSILIVVGLLVFVAWIAMCPADASLCGQGIVRR
jgi:hypothetical protein